MSQGQATRSTLAFFRVTHFMGWDLLIGVDGGCELTPGTTER
jgi:hypothetical protein